MKKLLALFIVSTILVACGKYNHESLESKMFGHWVEVDSDISEKAKEYGWNEDEHMHWEITLNPDGTFSDKYYQERINFNENGNGVYSIEDNILVTTYTHGTSNGEEYDSHKVHYYYLISSVSDRTLKLTNIGDNDPDVGGSNNIKSLADAKKVPAEDYLYTTTLRKERSKN